METVNNDRDMYEKSMFGYMLYGSIRCAIGSTFYKKLLHLSQHSEMGVINIDGCIETIYFSVEAKQLYQLGNGMVGEFKIAIEKC